MGEAQPLGWRTIILLLSHQNFKGCASAAQPSSALLFKLQPNYRRSLLLSAAVRQSKDQSHKIKIAQQ